MTGYNDGWRWCYGEGHNSCTTSHDSMAGTLDALTLCIGEGGRALGVIRDTSLGDQVVHDRVLRNAVAGFNDGAREHQLPEVRWS